MGKGERIKKLREANNLTQEHLAKRLNTTKQTISKYEKGIVTNIPSDRLEAMAEILNTTPAYILGWEEVQKKNNITADIVLRLRSDKKFFDLVEGLDKLTPEQFASIKQIVEVYLSQKG